tara:strand:- start:21171 stop:21614 length:444 start_codon:yes stop_codon:yes gene_type:complete
MVRFYVERKLGISLDFSYISTEVMRGFQFKHNLRNLNLDVKQRKHNAPNEKELYRTYDSEKADNVFSKNAVKSILTDSKFNLLVGNFRILSFNMGGNLLPRAEKKTFLFKLDMEKNVDMKYIKFDELICVGKNGKNIVDSKMELING